MVFTLQVSISAFQSWTRTQVSGFSSISLPHISVVCQRALFPVACDVVHYDMYTSFWEFWTLLHAPNSGFHVQQCLYYFISVISGLLNVFASCSKQAYDRFSSRASFDGSTVIRPHFSYPFLVVGCFPKHSNALIFGFLSSTTKLLPFWRFFVVFGFNFDDIWLSWTGPLTSQFPAVIREPSVSLSHSHRHGHYFGV